MSERLLGHLNGVSVFEDDALPLGLGVIVADEEPEAELGVTVCPGCEEQRWSGTGPCMSEQCKPGVRVRILVTGSRDWTDAETIRRALSEAWNALGRPHDAVLVQGECHLGGADRIAAETWRGWGYPVEGHPAEMGPDGHVLGPKRNAHMVGLGADLCLAFPLPSSRGTKNCMRLAREAGIPVKVYEPK